MRLLNRKSQLQRLLENLNDSLDALSAIKFDPPSGGGPSKALKAALPKDKARKAGWIAGGLAGLTAGSAGISSLRRRQEGARDDS
ncbi:MAG: hypothetical protein ACXVII_45055 [Solirubrobacteraceae bacterium]